MKEIFKRLVLDNTGAKDLYEVENIQSLWSGYGSIIRYGLIGADVESVVVKHISLVQKGNHPRGWNTGLSHRRKLKSYKVETAWYLNYSDQCDKHCRVPKCLAIESNSEEIFIVFEDLDASGYDVRKNIVSLNEMKACLQWLANFHAKFMEVKPDKLWEVGTYWHLDTRPDELNQLDDISLKKAAKSIDERLTGSTFQTIVHGDAKLANFCFSGEGNKVAALDFQYVGGGCGMKDVAYFIGSCLNEHDCEELEKELLDYYFIELVKALNRCGKNIDVVKLLAEWHSMFAIAWTDFHRFLKGWSPGHWKINSYSERLARQVVNELLNEAS